MAKQTYWELLKDPRWQKKRLDILNRDEWTCIRCKSTTKTLHIHHTYYEKGKMPWEYPDISLHTLCEDCHKQEQELMTVLHREIGKTDPCCVQQIIGYLRGLRLAELQEEAGEQVDNEDIARGIADAWGMDITPDEVVYLASISEGRVNCYLLDMFCHEKRKKNQKKEV